MTTLDFFNDFSTTKINQDDWEENIFINEYNDIKYIKEEYNNFSINNLYSNEEREYDLINYNDLTYKLEIPDLNMDTIDTISLEIKLNDIMQKIILSSFVIRISTKPSIEFIQILDSRLLDACFISYLNNYHINEDENTITIPLIQFNNTDNGYLYNKLRKKKIYINFANHITNIYNLDQNKYDNIIDNLKIKFNGKKYYNFDAIDIKDKYYKPMDMNWYTLSYKKNGISINSTGTKFQFIILSITKDFLNEIEIDESLYIQPEIEEIVFQYKDREPWIYDMKYVKKCVLFGINKYIIPFYPEFTNPSNILYYMKNSKNHVESYIDSYKILIKTNIDRSPYNINLTFFGEWDS